MVNNFSIIMAMIILNDFTTIILIKNQLVLILTQYFHYEYFN